MFDKLKLSFKLVYDLYLNLSKKRKLHFKLLFAFSVFVSLFEVATLVSLYPFLTVLLSPDKIIENKFYIYFSKNFSIFDDNILLLITFVFLFFLIFSSILRLILLWVNIKLANAISKDFSLEIFNSKIYQPYLDFINSNSNEAISSISAKTGSLNRVLIALNTLITSIFLSLSILLTVILINPLVSLTSFIIIFLIYLILVIKFNRILAKNSFVISKNQTLVVKILQESFGAIRDIILNSNQDKHSGYFFNSIKKLYDADAQNSFINQSPRFFIETAGIIIIIIICSYVAITTQNQTALLPTIGVMILAAQKIIPLMQQVYSNINVIVSNSGQISDLKSFLTPNKNKFLFNKFEEKLDFNEILEFAKVSFSYNKDNRPIINNLSFKIYKGEKIGILGQTGVGKSTLLDLIMGLLEPTEGKILIDGQLIDQHKIKSWQLNISHVPQNIFLIDGSILENIVFSFNEKEVVDFKQLQNSIDKSQLRNFIENLPEGYDTIVGERGVKLSGGQRQRIAIARAIYRFKKLLVFDEATSALDDRTEQLIGTSLEDLDKEITIIMVAHRLSSLKKCNRIFELKNNELKIYNSYNEYISNR